MGKLKAWNYLKNNKKRAAVLVISFGLYFALLYGVRFFLNPLYYTDEAIYIGNSELMQGAYINQGDKLPINFSLWDEGSGATEEDKVNELNRVFGDIAEELGKDPRIDHVILGYTYGVPIHTVAGNSYYYIPMVTKEQARLICDYLGVKLIKGTYPMEPGDVVMDQKMAKNSNLRIGDNLFGDSTRVCGIVSCKNYFAAGIEYDDLIVKRNLFFLDKGTLPDLKQFFQETGWEASENDASQIRIIYDLKNAKNIVQQTKDDLSMPLKVMVYVVTIVMGITLYFVYQLHVRDRYEEWCLYRSLGYSQREVFCLAIREYGFCILGGAILAILFLLLIFYLGGSMMESRGIVYRLWLPDTVLQITSIFILLTGILQIPVFNAMQHITTIDAIEDDI